MPSRLRRPLVWHFLVAVAVLLPALAGPAGAATPEQVDQAIERAKKYIYSQQKGGNWDHDVKDGNAKKTQAGGYTAIATYALLAAGESPQDPRIKQACEYLYTVDMTGIYALGLRTQVWNLIQQTPQVKAAIKHDATLLYDCAKNNSPKGVYHYTTAQKGYDHSCSQYGVLGAWACAQQGFEMPTDYWAWVDKAWKQQQRHDGGWAYSDSEAAEERGSTPSMTAAGVATLFITQDYLNQGRGADCRGNLSDPAIDKGLAWMSKHEKAIRNGNPYTLYGIERIGVASGLKYFGTMDWYRDGADAFVRRQAKDGNWGDVPNTSFGILFLVRGRAPVVMNKLEYEIDTAGDKATPAHWNQRHRDAARLVKWMSKENERYLNWQIVNLKVPIEDLHDSPILYLAGDQLLNFSKDEMAKLQQFVEQGGMILGNADCNSNVFATSFRKLGTKLFPSYEFRDLPADHPIYTLEQFPRAKWRSKPQVLGLSNGARELMILIPNGDPSKFWQMEVVGGREEFWQLPDDIFLYSIDKQNLRTKGDTYVVKLNSAKATHSIKVARLKYPGNWDPEPAGWRRLAAVMHNTAGTDLDVQTVELGSGKLTPAAFKVAHLTGTTPLKLTDAMRDELRKFVLGGGTVVLDACGGAAEFTPSAEAEVAAFAPAGSVASDARPDAKFPVLPMDHAVYAAGPAKLTDFNYRGFAKRTVGSLKAPRVRGVTFGGRVAIFLSAEDLSVGLVGQPVDGIYGYEPDTASAIMEHILLYVSPAPKPATRPATAKATTTAAKPKEKAKTTEAKKEDRRVEKDKPKPKPEPE